MIMLKLKEKFRTFIIPTNKRNCSLCFSKNSIICINKQFKIVSVKKINNFPYYAGYEENGKKTPEFYTFMQCTRVGDKFFGTVFDQLYEFDSDGPHLIEARIPGKKL